jgi:hypothetical protein
MDTLPRKKLYDLAPAAAPRRNPDKERLIDTTVWLDAVARKGFKPVFAMQSPTHQDAEQDPRDARHMVVVAREDGLAYTLLNSHDRLMRVWAGIGLWDGEEVLVRVTKPVQRWKGVSREQWSLASAAGELEKEASRLRKVSASDAAALASRIASDGYIKGRGRPSTRALIEAAQLSAKKVSVLDAAFALVGAARRGNLEPSSAKKERRNVKGIRRPDAYHLLSLVAYKAALDAASK